MKENMKKFESMEMKRLLIQMSLPIMISMIVMALYNIIDSMFVAKISEEALTALSLAFPIQIVIVAIFLGVGVGVNSYMARKLGEQDRDEAVNTAEHGLMLGLIISTLVGISAYFVPQHFFKLFTQDQVILDHAITYTRIIMIFSFGSILAEICMNILRATGDMMSSMKIQLLGAITNIILDPILIFGVGFIPAMGVKGAAIATIVGQLCSLTYASILIIQAKSGLKLSISKFHFELLVTKEIFRVAIPAMFMQLLGTVMVIGLNLILAAFSATSIAVFGAYFKLQSFIYMPVFGLTNGMMPIVGYNYGAKNYKRMYSAAFYSIAFAAMILFTGSIIFVAFPKLLLVLFNSSPEMTAMGVTCLRIIGSAFTFSSVGIVASAFFQAIGKPAYSLILSFARQIIILLPVAYFLSESIGLTGVWWAFPVSEISCCLLSLILLLKVRRNLTKSQDTVNPISNPLNPRKLDA